MSRKTLVDVYDVYHFRLFLRKYHGTFQWSVENTLNVRLLQECIPAAIELLLGRKRRILKAPVSLFD